MRVHRQLLSNRIGAIGEGVGAVMQKRRHYGRYLFVLILTTWWILGLFGLEGARRPSVPLVAVAVFAVVTYRIVSAERRRRARDQGLYSSATLTATLPQSCVVIRLGEPGPSPS